MINIFCDCEHTFSISSFHSILHFISLVFLYLTENKITRTNIWFKANTKDEPFKAKCLKFS